MANEVKLPRLGQGMEAGTITKWLKSEGDTVAKGEPLFEIDTDKVTQEVEADYAGVLLKIELASGEAPVGQTIAWIGEEGEEVQAGGGAREGRGRAQSAKKPRRRKRVSSAAEGAAATARQRTVSSSAPQRRERRVA